MTYHTKLFRQNKKHRRLTLLRCALLASLLLSAGASVAQTTDLPQSIEIVDTQVIEGRNATKYRHTSHPGWGYSGTHTDYFWLVEPNTPVTNSPLQVVLHSAGHDVDKIFADAFTTRRVPQYYADGSFYILYLDCKGNSATDWWWGYHDIEANSSTYAQKLHPAEERVLASAEWVIQQETINRNRVYLSGVSMGGSGSLGIGLIQGDIFAAISVAVPAGVNHMQFRSQMTANVDPPVLVNISSQVDTWAEGQEDLLAYFRTQHYALLFGWGPFGHTENNADYVDAGILEFPWHSLVRNEAYPVFTEATTDDTYPGYLNSTSPDQTGQINGYFRWENIEDSSERFAMNLWLLEDPGGSNSIPTQSEANITLRRLQQFNPTEDHPLQWQITTAGSPVQSGSLWRDSKGLIHLPMVELSNVPSLLEVTPLPAVVRPADNRVTYDWSTATGSAVPGMALDGNDNWVHAANHNDDNVSSTDAPDGMSGNWIDPNGSTDSQYSRLTNDTFSFSIPANANSITLSHVVNCDNNNGITWMGPNSSSSGPWRFGRRDANGWGYRDNDGTIVTYGMPGAAALTSTARSYKSTVFFDMIESNMYYKIERPTTGETYWLTRGTTYGDFTPSAYDSILYRASIGSYGIDNFTIDYTQPSDTTPTNWVYTFDTADSSSVGSAPSSDGWVGAGAADLVYSGNVLPTGYSGNAFRGDNAGSMSRDNDFLFNYAIPATATEVTLSCITEASGLSWAGVNKSGGGAFRFGVRDLSHWGVRETDNTITEFGESALAITEGDLYLAKIVIDLTTDTYDFRAQNITAGGSEVTITTGQTTDSWSDPTVFDGLFLRSNGGIDTISISYGLTKGTIFIVI